MKKIIKFNILVVLLGLVVLPSCNMEKLPYSSIPSIVTSVNDAEGLRVAMYSRMKGLTAGGSMLYPDYQGDMFSVPVDYGNFYADFYRWQMNIGSSDVASYWRSMYSYISNANFLIKGIDDLKANNTFTADEIKKLDLIYGETHFYRAFYYSKLAQMFCRDYEASTANQPHTGVMMVTQPFHSPNDFLPRGTLQELMDLILADLSIAESNINVEGKANSYYITSDIVKAFQARIALSMQDYARAASLAASIINSGRYELTIDREAFKGMWVMDDDIDGQTVAFDGKVYTKPSKELLWVIQVTDPNDSDQQPGRYFAAFRDGENLLPQFFPNMTLLNSYDQENDIRFDAFFTKKRYKIESIGEEDLYFFWKYPGNPKLQTASYSLYKHKGKPFRLAELYLIAAEAYYHANNTAEASNMLNALRSKRIENWENTTYGGANLLTEIQLERTRELCGEGFRLWDLRRWKQGFTRGATQEDYMFMFGDGYSNHSVQAGDYRFIWPIPKAETDQNIQLRDQQNPGY